MAGRRKLLLGTFACVVVASALAFGAILPSLRGERWLWNLLIIAPFWSVVAWRSLGQVTPDTEAKGWPPVACLECGAELRPHDQLCWKCGWSYAQ